MSPIATTSVIRQSGRIRKDMMLGGQQDSD
jgi:hypothetical protein